MLKALRAAGFEVAGQTGSHVKLRYGARTVIVKHPAGDVPPGTFAAILRQAGLTRQQFDAFRLRRRRG